jgi:hypothetical protein
MGLEKHLSEVQEWRSAIGKAIVCFGELELITYQCLAHITSDKISEASARMGFVRRVDLILEILEGRRPVPNPVENFVKLLRRARELASVRNDIAHNPVMLNMFVHSATGDVALEHCIATARGGRTIDLADVKEFADEVEDLAATMWLTIGKVAEDGQEAADA